MGPFETRHHKLGLKVPRDIDTQFLQTGANREFIFEQLLKIYDNTKHLQLRNVGEPELSLSTYNGLAGLMIMVGIVVLISMAVMKFG